MAHNSAPEGYPVGQDERTTIQRSIPPNPPVTWYASYEDDSQGYGQFAYMIDSELDPSDLQHPVSC